MNQRTFLNYLDLEKIESVYHTLMDMDLSRLSSNDCAYISGAMDAYMSMIGAENKLTKILNIDKDLSHEEKIKMAISVFIAQNPDCEVIGDVENEDDGMICE